MLKFFTFVILLVIFVNSVTSNRHVYGEKKPVDKLLYTKTFSKKAPTPSNYTMIFKYVAPPNSPNITSVDIDVVNALSSASIETNVTHTGDRSVQALINVINAMEFTVSLSIYGPNVFIGNTLNVYSAQFKPKTFTVFYRHNTTQSRNRIFSIGQRQPNDRIIEFQRKNVTLPKDIFKKFADDSFSFENPSKYITAIRFSFDSQTAIAFLNSTLIQSHKIEAIVYDLYQPMFEANMTIYGYNANDDFDKVLYQSIVAQKLTNQ